MILIGIILALAVAYIIYFNTCQDKKEHYGEGALQQLYLKGLEDVYLTTDTEKYIPEYWPNEVMPFLQSLQPRPLEQKYYPLYGIYPVNYNPLVYPL